MMLVDVVEVSFAKLDISQVYIQKPRQNTQGRVLACFRKEAVIENATKALE